MSQADPDDLVEALRAENEALRAEVEHLEAATAEYRKQVRNV